MDIRAVITQDTMTDIGFFHEGFVVEGKPALELVKRGIAKLVEEKRTALSVKKTVTRHVD